jgi:hypothetical protein
MHGSEYGIRTAPCLHDGKCDEEIRAAIGEKFPKHLYHSIICISALIAHREMIGGWSMHLAHRTAWQSWLPTGAS